MIRYTSVGKVNEAVEALVEELENGARKYGK
jgi:hypothetical protein